MSGPIQANSVTLEDVLVHSGKLNEELMYLIRTAARIDDTLSGNQMVEGDNQTNPKPAGMLYCLHDNLCELSQKVSALSSILGRIEDRLAQPKVAAAVPFPPPPPNTPTFGGVLSGGVYKR